MRTAAGSAEIEAAFVLPMAIVIVLLLLVYAFYLHDRTVLYAAAEEFLFEAASADEDTEEIEQDCLQALKKRLLMSDPETAVLSAEKKLTGYTYSLTVTAVFRLSGTAVKMVLPGRSGEIRAAVHMDAGIDPKTVIRFAQGFR